MRISGKVSFFFLSEQLQEVIAMEYNFKTFRILPAPTTPLLPHVLMAPWQPGVTLAMVGTLLRFRTLLRDGMFFALELLVSHVTMLLFSLVSR